MGDNESKANLSSSDVMYACDKRRNCLKNLRIIECTLNEH